jgi:putative AlgH/UPF0301 family transcriptional regulator
VDEPWEPSFCSTCWAARLAWHEATGLLGRRARQKRYHVDTGWAPGQLEGELARCSWVTVPADLALIFDRDRDKVWDIAYGRRTQDL